MSQALLQICYNYSVPWPRASREMMRITSWGCLRAVEKLLREHFTSAATGRDEVAVTSVSQSSCLMLMGWSINTVYYSRMIVLPWMDSFWYQCITDLAQFHKSFKCKTLSRNTSPPKWQFLYQWLNLCYVELEKTGMRWCPHTCVLFTIQRYLVNCLKKKETRKYSQLRS